MDNRRAAGVTQDETGAYSQATGNGLLVTAYTAESVEANWPAIEALLADERGWRLPWLNPNEWFYRVLIGGGHLLALREPDGEPGILLYGFLNPGSVGGAVYELIPLVCRDLAKWVPLALERFEGEARGHGAQSLHLFLPTNDRIGEVIPPDYAMAVTIGMKHLWSRH